MTIPPGMDEDEARDTFSKGFEDALKNYQGTRYHLGAKSGGRNGIDCSGFVYKALADSFAKLKGEGVTINPSVLSQLDCCSENQIEELNKRTGGGLTGKGGDFLAGGRASNQLKAGMVIGVSSGVDKGWNEGRALHIDHVVCTYKDSQTGELMVAESSGKKGVHASTLEEWLKKHKDKNLYAVDPVGLAANTTPATNSTPTTTPMPTSPVDTTGLGGTASASTPFNQNANPQNMLGMLMLLVIAAATGQPQPGGDPLAPVRRPQTVGPNAT